MTKANEQEQEFRRYLVDLAEKARNSARWGAAHSKAARGKLSGHWTTDRETLQDSKDILGRLGLPSTYSIDLAADPGSAVAPHWVGPFNLDPQRRDALAIPSWRPPEPNTSGWNNPPYSDIAAFAKRAAEYHRDERAAKRTVAESRPIMFLAFMRTDTRWFHRHIVDQGVPIWIREKRLKFVDPVTGAQSNSAPAPSFLGLFGAPEDLDLTPARRVGLWVLTRFL